MAAKSAAKRRTGIQPSMIKFGGGIEAVRALPRAKGKRPTPIEELIAQVACPVLGIFGEADHIISIDDVLRFRNCLEKAKKTVTFAYTATRRTAGSTTPFPAGTAKKRQRTPGA